MITTETGEYTILVKKVGRKWIQIEANCKSQVKINEISKEFEAGQKYKIYAKRKIDKNNYGTTMEYYPLNEDEYKESIRKDKLKRANNLLSSYEGFSSRHEQTKDKIIVLAEGDTETLQKLEKVEKQLKIKEEYSKVESSVRKINSALSFDSSSRYKFEYILKRIDDIKECTLVQEAYNKFYNERLDKSFEKCIECIKDMDKLKAKISSIIELNEKYGYTNIEFENKLHEECEEYTLQGIEKTKIHYKDGYAVNPIDFDLIRYTSPHIQRMGERVKKAQLSVNTAKLKYLIDNVFNVRSEESFKSVLNRLEIDYDDKAIDRFKAYDGNYYVLDYRLSSEDFKMAKDECGLVDMNDYNSYISRGYICTNPYLLLHKLVENGSLTVKSNHDLNDIDKIKLWSNEITEPFEYKKEEIDSQTYYFVTKGITNYDRFAYNAFYIVGWDYDTNRGFSHRLPWIEDGYHNKTVKDILEDTFKLNKGYKRIQGDVIVKEYNITTKSYTKEAITRVVNVNGKTLKTKAGLDNDWVETEEYIPTDITNEEVFPTYKEDICVIRKNLYIKGMRVIGGNMLYDGCKVYCNDKEVFSSETPVQFNIKELGTKIKYNLYYEPVEFTSSLNITTKKKNKYTLNNDFDGEELVYDNIEVKENSTAYLGDHEIDGLMVKNGNLEWIRKRICCFGKFKLNHSEHKPVTYGKEGKFYVIELATRHRKKLNINKD